MTRRPNRRRFIQESTLAGLGFWAAGGVALSGEGKAANDQINFACIGVQGKGDSDVDGAAKVGKIIALCDVDEDRLNAKASQTVKKGSDELKYPGVQKFTDYREMIDKLGDKIDAVTVSTPDHTHAPASLMAMRKGKHVYCQKPLTHTVYEAREMRETAAKMKVATQMGNQGSAENGLREAVEMIQAGAIGAVHEVHVWTNRPIWPQGPDAIMRVGQAREAALAALHGKSFTASRPTPPKNLHWDLFLGVAPERPYDPIYHPFAWRGWLDYGTGAIGDMACHTANMAYRALKLDLPIGAIAEAGDVNPETYPTYAKITLDFPARENLPPVKLHWYEGAKDRKKVLPPDDLVKIMRAAKEGLPDSGSLLVGEKGMLYSPNDYGAAYILLPEENFKGYQKPAPTLPRIKTDNIDNDMKVEWAAAIRGGPAAYSNFDIASRLTESMLLGNIAIRITGKQLQYDPENMKITNNADADKLLKTEYRTGW
jgi:predicted dehydrogenase